MDGVEIVCFVLGWGNVINRQRDGASGHERFVTSSVYPKYTKRMSGETVCFITPVWLVTRSDASSLVCLIPLNLYLKNLNCWNCGAKTASQHWKRKSGRGGAYYVLFLLLCCASAPAGVVQSFVTGR